jgi:hypothetical protein
MSRNDQLRKIGFLPELRQPLFKRRRLGGKRFLHLNDGLSKTVSYIHNQQHQRQPSRHEHNKSLRLQLVGRKRVKKD